MKKLITLLLALSILFVLTACGGNHESTPAGESTGETTITTESTTNTTNGTEGSTQDTTEDTTGGNTTNGTEGSTQDTTEDTTSGNTTDGTEGSTQDTTEDTTGDNTADTTKPSTTTPPTTTPPTTETPNKTNDTTAPVITDISLKQQGQTLKAGDTLTINVSIIEESDISTCQIGFENTTTGARINTHASFKHRSDGKYSYTYTITDTMGAGKWVLDRTFIRDKYDLYGDDTITDMSAIYFFVE